MINYDSDLLDSVNAKLQPIGLASLSNQALLQIIPYAANRYKILEATLTFIQASEQFQNVVRVFEGDGVGGLYVFCLVGWQGGGLRVCCDCFLAVFGVWIIFRITSLFLQFNQL